MPAHISEYVPQFPSSEAASRRRRGALAAWAVLAACVIAFVGATALAPWAQARGYAFLSGMLYMAYGAACHQIPERSFYIEGFPLAVCARCFGLYVGGAAAVLAFPLARALTNVAVPPRAWLLLAALPTSIDFALGFFGFWQNTHLSRFLTALLLGAVSAFYVVPAAVDLSLKRTEKRLSKARRLQHQGTLEA